MTILLLLSAAAPVLAVELTYFFEWHANWSFQGVTTRNGVESYWS